MFWYHYSAKNNLRLDNLYDLDCEGHPSYPFKPSGLWLSLNDEWYELQTDIDDERFVKKLKYKYEVKIRPDANLLKITTLEELNTFNEKYKVTLEDVSNDKEDYRIYNDKYGVLFPCWEKVCEDYDGMICLNYDEIFGQIFKENPKRMPWWNWLDINCSCIWRPSKVISSLNLI
jgi:hypothetical protein